jgi:Rieske Fe-S protein
VLFGAGALGTAGVLGGCSTASVPYDANDAGQAPATTAAMPAPGKQAGVPLGQAAEVPIGGGMVFASAKVVVTQPAKGVFRAFSAVCTHVGCVCNQVADGTIDCPCHGSKFKITDGSIVTGPASAPLAAKTITVTDGKIFAE